MEEGYPAVKKEPNGQLIKDSDIKDIRRPARLEKLVEAENDCLSALALNGLHRKQIEFTPDDLDEIVGQFEAQGLSCSLEQNLNQLSCLHVEKDTQTTLPVSYQFLHLTFQEFFAAKWLVKRLHEDKPLGLLQDPLMRPALFIQQHKYHPRYEIVWWFMAGLLSDKPLQRFFEHLEQGPQDLIGIQHQRLMMHCLKESQNRLPYNQRQRLESHLKAWLQLEVRYIVNDFRSISSLGREAAFPEALLLSLLQDSEVSHKHKEESTMVRALGQRAVLSKEALQCLMVLSKDPDQDVRRCVAEALGKHSALPPEALQYLMALSKDPKRDVRRRATEALGRQSALSPEALQCLMVLSKDPEQDVRGDAAEALGQQSALSSEALQCLMALSKDPDKDVRKRAAWRLGQQSALSSEALRCLMALFKDPDKGVREGPLRR